MGNFTIKSMIRSKLLIFRLKVDLCASIILVVRLLCEAMCIFKAQSTRLLPL